MRYMKRLSIDNRAGVGAQGQRSSRDPATSNMPNGTARHRRHAAIGVSGSVGGNAVSGLTDRDVNEIVDLFALFANPTRLRLLLALTRFEPRILTTSRKPDLSPPHELCVCDLAVAAHASESMTSHQLRILRDAGIVAQRRSGRHVFYRVSSRSIAHLLRDALDHIAERNGGF